MPFKVGQIGQNHDVFPVIWMSSTRVVELYLNRRGVSKYRMTMNHYGSDNPVGDEKTEEGRQANRRVEIKFQETSK
ncbi:MAG: hypothetical protein WCQ47_08445 [bacterium]